MRTLDSNASGRTLETDVTRGTGRSGRAHLADDRLGLLRGWKRWWGMQGYGIDFLLLTIYEVRFAFYLG